MGIGAICVANRRKGQAPFLKLPKRAKRVSCNIFGLPNPNLKTPRAAESRCLGLSNCRSDGGLSFGARWAHTVVCNHWAPKLKRRINGNFTSPKKTTALELLPQQFNGETVFYYECGCHPGERRERLNQNLRTLQLLIEIFYEVRYVRRFFHKLGHRTVRLEVYKLYVVLRVGRVCDAKLCIGKIRRLGGSFRNGNSYVCEFSHNSPIIGKPIRPIKQNIILRSPSEPKDLESGRRARASSRASHSSRPERRTCRQSPERRQSRHSVRES